jgi:hypothetical protein
VGLRGDTPVVVSLSTEGLPPGPYELHIDFEPDGGGTGARGLLPFVLRGRPGPFAIRLASRTIVDGVVAEVV